MEDPKVFTRPWTIRWCFRVRKDVGLLDYECTAMLDNCALATPGPVTSTFSEEGRDAETELVPDSTADCW